MPSYFPPASLWLRGSCAAAELHTPAVHSDCLLLHGYRQSCPTICLGRAELPANWLGEEINTSTIGCCSVAHCCDWPGWAALAPWRLSLCKHPGCFIQPSVFTSSPVLPVCANWGRVSLRSSESGESGANWLPVPPYVLWLKKLSALLWHFDSVTGEDTNSPQPAGSLTALLLFSPSFILHPNFSVCDSAAGSCHSGSSSPTGYMFSLWWCAEQRCLGAQAWKINCPKF